MTEAHLSFMGRIGGCWPWEGLILLSHLSRKWRFKLLGHEILVLGMSCRWRWLLLKVILPRSSIGSETGQSILRSIRFFEISRVFFVIRPWCLFNIFFERRTMQQVGLRLLLPTILMIGSGGGMMSILGSWKIFCTLIVWVALTRDWCDYLLVSQKKNLNKGTTRKIGKR